MSGLLLAILAVLFWGAAPIFEKVGLVRISPVAGLSIRSFIAAGVMLAVVLATGQARELTTVRGWTLFYIAMGALSAAILGQFFYFSALKHGQTSIVVPLVGAYPLVTTLLGIVVLREGLTWPKALGVIMIVSGVILLGWTRR